MARYNVFYIRPDMLGPNPGAAKLIQAEFEGITSVACETGFVMLFDEKGELKLGVPQRPDGLPVIEYLGPDREEQS